MRKLRVPIAFVLCLLLMGLYFLYISLREPRYLEEKPDVSSILQTDLQDNYPATPEAVVTFYSKILSCFYSQNLNANQINLLEMQARELMDKELLENYQQAQYTKDIETKIKDYKKSNITYIQGTIRLKRTKKNSKQNNENYSFVTQTYYTHHKSVYTKHKNEYRLKKNAEGKWLIDSFS